MKDGSSVRILVIDEDSAMARLISDSLKGEGFQVETCDSGRDAAAIARRFAPDLVLLDVMLPRGEDGLRLCESFSSSPDRIPVIIVSTRGEKDDRVRGLQLGADDYVVKPFALDELLARIHAVLRRAQPRLGRITLGPTTVDFMTLRAFKGDRELSLTEREFEVLRHLVDRVGNVVSREELLHLVWGRSDVSRTRTVDNFILRLRQKIEVDPHHPKYIRKAYGDGYRLTLSEL